MTRKVMVGDVAIGGDAPVSVQSMTNTDTRDIRSTLKQINELYESGCQIVRIAVPDSEAAEAVKHIKKESPVPIVADIHFDYRLAIKAAENGADKLRINPGNIGDKEQLTKITKVAKERKIPIRIGVNSGSLEKDLINKYGGITAEALFESAENSVEYMMDTGFEDLVLSVKSSDVVLNYQTHMLIKDKLDIPLHIGITEAGTVKTGMVKSAIGIGSLLLRGIGDTIRVSLTGNPIEEVKFAKEILKSLGMLDNSINLISCPTCGRCRIDLVEIAKDVEKMITSLEPEMEKYKPGKIDVAVMGCAVNGPGEAKNADIGIAGGKGKGILISKGEILASVPEEELTSALEKEIRRRYFGDLND